MAKVSLLSSIYPAPFFFNMLHYKNLKKWICVILFFCMSACSGAFFYSKIFGVENDSAWEWDPFFRVESSAISKLSTGDNVTIIRKNDSVLLYAEGLGFANIEKWKKTSNCWNFIEGAELDLYPSVEYFSDQHESKRLGIDLDWEKMKSKFQRKHGAF